MNTMHVPLAFARGFASFLPVAFYAAQSWSATLPSPVPRDDFWVTDGPVLSLLEHNNTLYVGGNFVNVGPNTGKGAVLPNFSAVPDATWPKLQATVYAAVPDGSGGWFVGGDSFNANEADPNGGIGRYLLTHLKSDKTLDAGFDPQPSGQVYTLLKDGNTLFAGGNFGSVGGQVRSRLAAIDLTTGQGTAWNPGPDSYVYALAKSGNTVYVGGAFVNVSSQERRGLAAVDATSGALQTFPALGFGGIVNCLLLSGNTLYVGGMFTSIGGVNRTNLAAVNLTDGSVLTAFDAQIDDPSTGVYALATDGATLYAGGYFFAMGGVPSVALAALNATTGQNLGLNLNPVHFGNANVASLALNGTNLYIGGRFDTLNGVNRNYLALIDTVNHQLQPWNPRAAGGGFAGQVMRVVAHDGNNLFVGGEFSSVGAQARNYLAAFDVNTGEATSWNPNGGGSVWALAQHNNIIYAGGEFYSMGGALRNLLAGIDLNGNVTSLNSGFGVFNYHAVQALLVSGNSLYVGGGFSVNGSQGNLARFDLSQPTPTLDAWNPNPGGTVYALGLDGSTLYVGGSFPTIGGQLRNNLAAVDTTTGNATSWDPNANGFVLSMAVGPTAVYASGGFTEIGGQSRRYIGAVSKSTGLVTTWDPGAISTARAMELAGNHLLLGGDFNYYVGDTRKVSYFAVADTEFPYVLPLDLQVHPSRVFAIHRGARHYYLGGDQSGSRNTRRPNLSVHRLAPFLHAPQVQAGGQAVLNLDGLPNQNYLVETTSDFQSWQSLGTYSDANGAVVVNDAGAIGQTPRFYRASEQNQPPE